MKTYDKLVDEMRKLYMEDESGPGLDAVHHLWEEYAPNWNSRSQGSREQVMEFWADVADWAGKLSVAATVCVVDKPKE
jgi:hypothetical protein